MTSRNKYYKDYLSENASRADPWTDLANAIVAQAADDYRRLCKRLVGNGAKMEPFAYNVLNGRIKEIEVFFKSDWGVLLSHGLSPVIWEKLQAEFADDINEMLVRREKWLADQNQKRRSNHETKETPPSSEAEG